MEKYIIDCKEFKDVESFHKAMKRCLKLPEYYGENLDALWDVLTERNELNIKIVNKKYLLSNLGEYGEKIIQLFEDLREESENYTIKIY